jgi:hypothetical protein
LDTSTQSTFYIFEEPTSTGTVELFPAVWTALENITDVDQTVRMEALEYLLGNNTARFSPLVAYIFCTMLSDPNKDLRAKIVQTLGEVLLPDAEGQHTPEEVRRHLVHHLSKMRRRPIYSILQTVVDNPGLVKHVHLIMNACPYAGNHLADILGDRGVEISVRKMAAYYIGDVGFMDAVSALTRLLDKLTARFEGQKVMPFAPPSVTGETALLPYIRDALSALQQK